MSFVVAKMVTLLFTSLFVLVLLAIAIYFWQKTATPLKPEALPDPPGRALFPDGTPANTALLAEHDKARAAAAADRHRSQIHYRAHVGDKTALLDAQSDQTLYEEVLNGLTSHARSPGALLALASFMSRNNLRVNKSFAEKFVDSHTSGLERGTVAKMLHIAALSDDATVFQKAMAAAMKAWRSGGLAEASAPELQAILEGEFWILSASTRSSGSGFLLKQELAAARRELSAAP